MKIFQLENKHFFFLREKKKHIDAGDVFWALGGINFGSTRMNKHRE